ncbi:MAG: hypothetical protein QOK28_371, partial [Actinomycetota bacterium]
MTRKPLKLAAVMLALGLTAGACGGNSKTDNAAADSHGNHSATTAAAGAGGGIDTGASSLQSALTSLLQEHVYLAGIATGTALGGGDLKPAAAALEKNTQGLQDAI